MKHLCKLPVYLIFVLLLWGTYGCDTTPQVIDPEEVFETEEIDASAERRGSPWQQRVVVANRVSKDISVVDARNNTLLGTYAMPDDGEPMYVVHIRNTKKVFVGDRANNRVVAFDQDDFSVKGTAPAGNGVFHMWASPQGHQLWVNNDIDNTTTIINPHNMHVRGTAQTPADLVALGGKPHDVLVDPNGRFAYVSVLGVTGPHDYIIKYSAHTFQEVARAAVGKDPHLSATFINHFLYVPCQGTNEVIVLNRWNLSTVTTLPFTGAHGAGMARSGRYFYVTGISNATIGTIKTGTNTLVGSPVSTPFATPHNLAVNAFGTKLFCTHSGGTADKLSIYTLSPTPTLLTDLTIGTNPFGLTYYYYRK